MTEWELAEHHFRLGRAMWEIDGLPRHQAPPPPPPFELSGEILPLPKYQRKSTTNSSEWDLNCTWDLLSVSTQKGVNAHSSVLGRESGAAGGAAAVLIPWLVCLEVRRLGRPNDPANSTVRRT